MTAMTTGARVVVRRRIGPAVVALLVVYVVLGIVWWSGIGAIHLAVEGSRVEPDAATGRREATLHVRNDSPTQLRFVSVDLIDGRFSDVSADPATVPGRSPADLHFRYTAECGATRPFPNAPVVVLHFETIAGLERTVHADGMIGMECAG